MPHLQQVCSLRFSFDEPEYLYPNIISLQAHLPHTLTKRAVYHTMMKGLREQGHDSFISESHFYLTWEKEYKSVVVPKVTNFYTGNPYIVSISTSGM